MSLDEFHAEHPDNRGADEWSRLLRLKPTHPIYAQVESRFRSAWEHPNKPLPHVHAVFKVVYPEPVLKPYLDYRESISLKLAEKPALNAQNPGNETLLFHGTTRACMLGEFPKKPARLCGLPECSLCRIIRSSYDLKRAGSKHTFRRFGNGIYTTACSSKADDYTLNHSHQAISRAILLNRVVVGKALRRRYNATYLTEPPYGHHSVIGEPGANLNYEETVVYDNDAIRPAYLVVYGDEPIKHELKFGEVIKTLFSTPLMP